MCKETADPGAGGVTYDSTESLLAAITPGMDLCTSDFTGWATVEGVQPARDGRAGFIVARTHARRLVHVPPEVVIAIHDGHCVRIDRARATIDQQGWEVADTQDWLARFAAEVGTTPPTPGEMDLLLALAGTAARAAERTAAPITCWLAARAGVAPQDALAAGQRLAAKLTADGPLA
jgi:hypothetical protein